MSLAVYKFIPRLERLHRDYLVSSDMDKKATDKSIEFSFGYIFGSSGM